MSINPSNFPSALRPKRKFFTQIIDSTLTPLSLRSARLTQYICGSLVALRSTHILFRYATANIRYAETLCEIKFDNIIKKLLSCCVGKKLQIISKILGFLFLNSQSKTLLTLWYHKHHRDKRVHIQEKQ